MTNATIQRQTTVDPEWITYVTRYADIFGDDYIGYWAFGVERDNDRGWLLYEDCDGKPTRAQTADAVQAWRADQPLPEGFHRLDRDACIKAWGKGVEKWGEDWYENGDATSYDIAIQLALFGEVVYG